MQYGLFVGGSAVGPPFAPGVGVVAEFGAGDQAKRAVDPAARRGIERVVIEQIQQFGNSGEALLFCEHAGLRKVTAGALADARGWIVREPIKQRIDGRVGAEQRKTFDGPVARDLVAVMYVMQELREDKLLFDAAIAERAEMP